MRWSFFGKVGILAMLAVASAATTSFLLSRAPAARAARREPSREGEFVREGDFMVLRVAPTKGVPAKGAQARAPRGAGPGKSTVESSGAILLKKWSIAGNRLTVSATAAVEDTRPGMAYVWAIRIFEPSNLDVPVFEKVFTEKAFGRTAPEQRRIEAEVTEFLDLPLPAGKYRMETTWFAVHPDLGLAMFADPAARARFQGPSSRVTIALR